MEVMDQKDINRKGAFAEKPDLHIIMAWIIIMRFQPYLSVNRVRNGTLFEKTGKI